MEIDFASKKLRKLCEDPQHARATLGGDGARKLATRLADIEAAATVSDLVVGKPHPMHGDMAGSFAVNLDQGRRLVFEPNDDPIPVLDDGSTDWKRVSHVKISSGASRPNSVDYSNAWRNAKHLNFIGDYHE